MYTLEQLADGDTTFHRIHPMVKLVTTFFYIIAVISVGRYDMGALIPYLFYPSIIMAVSETPYHHLLKRLVLTLPLAVLAGASNIIFDTKVALFVGSIGVSYGVISFFTILLKTYLTVMAALILASTTSLQDLSHQAVRLGVPAIMVMLITMIYRYLSILLNEASTMFTAYLLHSPQQKGIRIQHMGSFVGQLLLRSIDRAERVYYAMKCRGFRGAEGYAPKQDLTVSDWIYGSSVCVLAVVFRFVDFVGLLGRLFI